jgi:sulfatase modifying factor 1
VTNGKIILEAYNNADGEMINRSVSKMKKIPLYLLTAILILVIALAGCGGGGGGNNPPSPGGDNHDNPGGGNNGDDGTTSRSYTVEGVTFTMRYVPGGLTFPTDSAVNAFNDDTIATVSNAYWIAETEVTYELWYKVYVWAMGHGYNFSLPGREGSDGARITPPDPPAVPTGAPANEKFEPVTTISWYDAIVWCNALSELAESSIAYKKDGVAVRDASKTNDCKGVSYSATDDKSFRLPTSHEWELAARYKGNDNSNGAIQESGLYWTPGTYASGATEYAYNSGGANPNQNPTIAVAIYDTTCTAKVKSKVNGANDLGLYDMSGNVWEWCFDTYPASSSKRVSRGGAWDYTAEDQRLGYVYGIEPSTYGSIIGFRLVRTD